MHAPGAVHVDDANVFSKALLEHHAATVKRCGTQMGQITGS